MRNLTKAYQAHMGGETASATPLGPGLELVGMKTDPRVELTGPVDANMIAAHDPVELAKIKSRVEISEDIGRAAENERDQPLSDPGDRDGVVFLVDVGDRSRVIRLSVDFHGHVV